ncbi:MAG: M48 family metalloprotease [Chloroflexota bacterium]|nr:M48 family metalloprotease [Chloroflexota bacterium]
MIDAARRPRMDPDRLRRARSYRKFSLALELVTAAVGIVVMLGLYWAGTGVAVRDAFAHLLQGGARPCDLVSCPGGTPVRAGVTYLVIVVFTLIGSLVALPEAYLGWRRGRREGLVVQSWRGELADRAKALVITVVLVGVPVTAWYLILVRPEWAAWTIVGSLVLSAAGTLAGPTLAGLFFRFEPLADAEVAQRVRAVAERAGVRVSGVYRWGMAAKTTAANAAVLGVGPTKRIVLGDTLLERFPMEEVESVVAHEVGHDVSGDPPRYVVALGIAGAAALVVIRVALDRVICGAAGCAAGAVGPVGGVADPASYPLVAAALALLSFVGRPALMAFTRWRESAADVFGARHTSPDSMGRALVRLADQNLSDPEPPRWEEIWFYSHPRIADRVRKLGLRWEDVG